MRKERRARILRAAGKALIYLVLVIISFVYLEPIIRVISKTFMSGQDVIDPSVQWLPKAVSADNLRIAAKVLNLGVSLPNTVWFSALLAACQTLVSALTGYALSRYVFRFRRFWFMMILLAFIVPQPVLMVPRLMMFITFQESTGVRMIGTALPQVAMALLGQGVYSTVLILIFFNFFNMIPHVLDEAAMMDGAGPMQVFYHVVVRLSMTTVLVVFLFSLVWNWNETYVTGTLVAGTIELLPGKLNLFDQQFGDLIVSAGSAFRLNEAYKMAATFISILPLLALYLVVQKRFIQGIENTGITGE